MPTMLFNPYTGAPRHPSDIQSDPAGILLLDPDEPMRASPSAKGMREVYRTEVLPMHRAGWTGVWDALVAAVTGSPRRTVPTPVTFSVFATDDVMLQIHQPCVTAGLAVLRDQPPRSGS